MEKVRIQICIPTQNNCEELDKTLRSIGEQEFNKEDVFISIMDFGSTDGTYEEILKHTSQRLGIYRMETTNNRRQMLNMLQETIWRCLPSGKNTFTVVLYPGDIIYPDFLETCTLTMLENSAVKPLMCVCEADIWDDNGKIVHQKPLFDDNHIIDGYEDVSEYVKRGYKHMIQTFGKQLSRGKYRSYGMTNERRWWNKLAYTSNEQMVCYINKPLACLKQIKYEDELEEILLRWESIIIQVRTYETQYGYSFDNEFSTLAFKNLAEYALWRSYLIYSKDIKQSEDCFMIASVICPEVVDTEIWKKTEMFFRENSIKNMDFLEDYYCVNGWR